MRQLKHFIIWCATVRIYSIEQGTHTAFLVNAWVIAVKAEYLISVCGFPVYTCVDCPSYCSRDQNVKEREFEIVLYFDGKTDPWEYTVEYPMSTIDL